MTPSIQDIREYITRLLSTLPAHLYYHSTRHTLDVMQQCTEIGTLEGISEEDMYLLQVAALFHDTGFLHTYDGHEEMSCRIARDCLPAFGFKNSEVETITGLIRCTLMPQQPTSSLGEILCDADLDYLGRTDFQKISSLLFDELLAVKRIEGLQQWNDLQMQFLMNHKYFTPSNKSRRDAGKKKNLETVALSADSL